MGEDTRGSRHSGPDLIAFRFDIRNGRAPLEGILTCQGQEFLGRELLQQDNVPWVLPSLPGPPQGPHALPPALQSPLPTAFLWLGL